MTRLQSGRASVRARQASLQGYFMVTRGISVEMAVGLLVAIYALMAVGLAVFQRRFLYFPDRRLTHPAEAGMSGVEELRLVTDDGERCLSPGIFLRGRD